MTSRGSSGEPQRSTLGQLVVPLLVTLVSIAMVVGSILLARIETVQPPSPTQDLASRPTPTPFLPTLTPLLPTHTPAAPSSPTETPQPTARPTEASDTPTIAPTQTPTGVPSPTPVPMMMVPPTRVCSRPAGWVLYIVRPGDTLTRLARLSYTTVWALMNANCLDTTALFAGQTLYLPEVIYPTPTPTPYLCGPPMNWVIYYVQPGDTLYALAGRFSVSIEALRRANCLRTNAIYLGQALYVPPLPPTPLPSATPTLAPSSTPTQPTAPTATMAPSATPTPPSPTLTHTPATPEPTSTSTPVPSATPSSTWTPVPTPVPTDTVAPTPTTPPAPTATIPTATTAPAPTETAASSG